MVIVPFRRRLQVLLSHLKDMLQTGLIVLIQTDAECTPPFGRQIGCSSPPPFFHWKSSQHRKHRMMIRHWKTMGTNSQRSRGPIFPRALAIFQCFPLIASSRAGGIRSAIKAIHFPCFYLISTTLDGPFFQGRNFAPHPTFGH